jgi:eukaryotic-like serine/threonine-protein kinase
VAQIRSSPNGRGRSNACCEPASTLKAPTAPPSDPQLGADPAVPRRLGRFVPLRLEGRGRRSMAWRVREDPPSGDGGEYFLVLPRVQPADNAALLRWQQDARRASRLDHPNLAGVVEIGNHDRWPYVLYDAAGLATLDERMQAATFGANEACELLVAVLRGLAFAHDGGVVHGDLQPYLILLAEMGEVRLMGLEVGMAPADEAAHEGPDLETPMALARTSIDALALHAQRQGARRDVLCAGMVFHRLLSGQPPLGEADVGAAVERLPPAGRDLVRLPWDIATPVPEALRAIANRATDRQERQRYRSARGLVRALEGWLQAEGAAGGGPLALLLDRLHSVGALPASPGSTERAARLALMDRERTNELAAVVLQDLGLSFELLRAVNSAQVRGAQVAGSGPVLTVRRAIAMLGLDGVRRAALGLRPWPGPLPDSAAHQLRLLFDDAKRAGNVAQALRPAGYDAEVVHLVTLLQNLGRLITCYHFPDELQQIRRLMQSAPGAPPGGAADPGMSEQAASYAVLGADIEAIGAAVARQWGLDDSVLHLIRRLPASTLPRTIDNDEGMLRTVASCANEAVDALSLPAAARQAALRRVAQRYGRVLNLELRDLVEVLNLTGRGHGGMGAWPMPDDDQRANQETPQDTIA